MQHRIFLASSIVELSHDRNAVGNFVRQLNDALRDIEGDHYLNLFICELEDATMSEEGKQVQYNRYLQSCDLFLNLYFNKAGEFTLQELAAAQAARQEQGKPELLVMFREADCDRRVWQPDGSIEALKADLQQEQISCLPYQTVNTVKLELLKWLQAADPSLPISIHNGVGQIGKYTVLKLP